MLEHLKQLTTRTILIGTWRAATWAISFYQKNGFRLVDEDEKNRLLKTYWTVPERQIQESVVLASIPAVKVECSSGSLLLPEFQWSAKNMNTTCSLIRCRTATTPHFPVAAVSTLGLKQEIFLGHRETVYDGTLGNVFGWCLS